MMFEISPKASRATASSTAASSVPSIAAAIRREYAALGTHREMQPLAAFRPVDELRHLDRPARKAGHAVDDGVDLEAEHYPEHLLGGRRHVHPQRRLRDEDAGDLVAVAEQPLDLGAEGVGHERLADDAVAVTGGDLARRVAGDDADNRRLGECRRRTQLADQQVGAEHAEVLADEHHAQRYRQALLEGFEPVAHLAYRHLGLDERGYGHGVSSASSPQRSTKSARSKAEVGSWAKARHGNRHRSRGASLQGHRRRVDFLADRPEPTNDSEGCNPRLTSAAAAATALARAEPPELVLLEHPDAGIDGIASAPPGGPPTWGSAAQSCSSPPAPGGDT